MRGALRHQGHERTTQYLLVGPQFAPDEGGRIHKGGLAHQAARRLGVGACADRQIRSMAMGLDAEMPLGLLERDFNLPVILPMKR